MSKKKESKPKTLTPLELAEEVAEIDSEAFDLISEMVEEEFEERRKKLSPPKVKFITSWFIRQSKDINSVEEMEESK